MSEKILFRVGDAVEVVDGCGRPIFRGIVQSLEAARIASGGRVVENRVPVMSSAGFIWWISPARMFRVSN